MSVKARELQEARTDGNERTSPGRAARPGATQPIEGPHLVVKRDDIRFHNEDPDHVILRILVHNEGSETSEATTARIETAPFGAFVPWRPLGEVEVPPVPARGQVILRLRARVEPLPSLGPPDRITTEGLLTAFDLGDRDPSGRRDARLLPPDLFRALGLGHGAWAGNFNVFLGEEPVERHWAGRVRVTPGAVNRAVFFLGSGPDAYRLDCEGDGTAWQPSLARPGSMLFTPGTRIPLGEWHEFPYRFPVVLSFFPTTSAGSREMRISVRQRSTGKTAYVEFTLDRDADGPGCYVVR
jgi:hypothetical protein